ncbi:CPBP family intramembrane metalloprotease [Elizabethkingia argentiflava]|uniref:CPBP family intramembrane metalloprotease n=1 Tax=Elizabethkingia argenteiflava TaxID=2681556 RepID=A0A845PS37_9FLAO|nr:CPBP family intramembrane glutamic endopeptidase [Elizabethkingia argenteiflava]NAW51079.1 CPBP family intramembrane metalloprotease [Elizabethkingia argenteiflava]
MEEYLHPGREYLLSWRGAVLLISVFLFMQLGMLQVWEFVQGFISSVEIIKMTVFFMMVSYVLTFLGCIFAFDQFIVKPTTGSRLNFNMKSVPTSTYFIVFPLMLGGIFIVEYLTGLIPTTGKFFGPWYEQFQMLFKQMSWEPMALFLMTSFFAPVLEEIIFRGIIQKGMINKGVSPAKSIFISAVIFGLVHANPWQFLGALLIGLIFGYVYFKTKTLLLPILLHAFNNFLSSMLMLYTSEESLATFFKISEIYLLLIGVVIISFFGYLFIYKNKIHYKD